MASRLLIRLSAALLALLSLVTVFASVPRGPLRDGLTFIGDLPLQAGRTQQVYGYDAALGVHVPLTAGASVVRYDWSNDGAQLAYIADGFYVLGPHGKKPEISEGNSRSIYLYWSPDDSQVLILANDNTVRQFDPVSGDVDLFTVTNLQYIDPRLFVWRGPNHVLLRGQGVQAPRLDLYHLYLDTSVAVSADELPCSGGTVGDFALSPDGSTSVYRCASSSLLYLSSTDDPTGARQLLPDPFDDRLQSNPRWSHDGRYLLLDTSFYDGSGIISVYSVEVDGGSLRRYRLPLGVRDVGWLPPEPFHDR